MRRWSRKEADPEPAGLALFDMFHEELCAQAQEPIKKTDSLQVLPLVLGACPNWEPLDPPSFMTWRRPVDVYTDSHAKKT